MRKKFHLELHTFGGGLIEKDITYFGDSLEEIARQADEDHNELVHYLMTGDDKGAKAFCFRGFTFQKEGIVAAFMEEGLIDL